jgi:uncharacterized protein
MKSNRFSLIKNHPAITFVVLAFALSWWVWPFHLLNPNSVAMIPFGPVIAAFIVTGITEGKAGTKDLLRRMFRWRVNIGWYALALLLPLAAVYAAININVLFGAPVPEPVPVDAWLVLLLSIPLRALVAGGGGEEPGWRGFLLPRLQASRSPFVASAIVAAVWTVWHLPILLTDTTGQRPALQFALFIAALSFFFTWVCNNARQSLLILIVIHGTVDAVAAFFFPQYIDNAADYSRLWWIMVALWGVASATVLLVSRLRRTQSPEVSAAGPVPSTVLPTA